MKATLPRRAWTLLRDAEALSLVCRDGRLALATAGVRVEARGATPDRNRRLAHALRVLALALAGVLLGELASPGPDSDPSDRAGLFALVGAADALSQRYELRAHPQGGAR